MALDSSVRSICNTVVNTEHELYLDYVQQRLPYLCKNLFAWALAKEGPREPLILDSDRATFEKEFLRPFGDADGYNWQHVRGTIKNKNGSKLVFEIDFPSYKLVYHSAKSGQETMVSYNGSDDKFRTEIASTEHTYQRSNRKRLTMLEMFDTRQQNIVSAINEFVEKYMLFVEGSFVGAHRVADFETSKEFIERDYIGHQCEGVDRKDNGYMGANTILERNTQLLRGFI